MKRFLALVGLLAMAGAFAGCAAGVTTVPAIPSQMQSTPSRGHTIGGRSLQMDTIGGEPLHKDAVGGEPLHKDTIGGGPLQEDTIGGGPLH